MDENPQTLRLPLPFLCSNSPMPPLLPLKSLHFMIVIVTFLCINIQNNLLDTFSMILYVYDFRLDHLCWITKVKFHPWKTPIFPLLVVISCLGFGPCENTCF